MSVPPTKESGSYARGFKVDEVLALIAERDALREALVLCNGDDVRLNGCTCKPLAKCYLHGVVVAKALGRAE